MKIIKVIFENLSKVFLFFLPPLVVFVAHVILSEFFDIYWRFPRFDIPMHFVGGLCFTYSLVALYKFLQKNRVIPEMDLYLSIFFIFTAISTVTIFWEFSEFFSDYFLGTQAQISTKDTMLDMFLGMTGGLLVALFFKFIGKNENKK